jgi:hypothetical protein
MPIERPNDVPFGMPSPEALQMAIDAMRRDYVLPETLEHPAVRSECLRLAYLIQAYGLASTTPEPPHEGTGKPRNVDTAVRRIDLGRLRQLVDCASHAPAGYPLQ